LWIAPVLGGSVTGCSSLARPRLQAFNDNAAITYLSSLVPTFTPE
jgi:hypothetical protein